MWCWGRGCLAKRLFCPNLCSSYSLSLNTWWTTFDETFHPKALISVQSFKVNTVTLWRNRVSCLCCAGAALMFDGPITENGRESLLFNVGVFFRRKPMIEQPHITMHKLWGLTSFSRGSCWYFCPFCLKSKSAQRLRRSQNMKPKFPFRRKDLV